MSAFQTFGADAAFFHGAVSGETVQVRVAGAAQDVSVDGVIVLRGRRDGLGRLMPRTESSFGGGEGRLAYELEVQIPTSLYPDVAGTAGLGRPTEKVDVIKVKVVQGDTILSPRFVAKVLGGGGAGGMWHLGLE